LRLAVHKTGTVNGRVVVAGANIGYPLHAILAGVTGGNEKSSRHVCFR
jgi:hypothetical protein